jgi:hypothetical protein
LSRLGNGERNLVTSVSVFRRRVFDAVLDDALHVPATVEHTLNRNRDFTGFVVNQVVVEAADDPKAQPRVARFPAGARSEFRVVGEQGQSLFYLRPEPFRRVRIAGGDVAVNAGQVRFGPAG